MPRSSDTIDRVVKNVTASCGSAGNVGAIGAPDYALTRQMMCFKEFVTPLLLHQFLPDRYPLVQHRGG
jgi:hypothetical protein